MLHTPSRADTGVMSRLRKAVDPKKPHLSDKVVIGVNYRGLGLFDENNQCYLSYP